MKRLASLTLVTGVVVMGWPGNALATQPAPDHKVAICHRTNSITNPYVYIVVDEAAVNRDTGDDNGQGDHNAEHLGPVFDASNPPPPPHNGDQWGDIIPPFYEDGSEGYWPSLNWTDAGQAYFDNGCQIPNVTPSPTPPPTTPPPTSPPPTSPPPTTSTTTTTPPPTTKTPWTPTWTPTHVNGTTPPPTADTGFGAGPAAGVAGALAAMGTTLLWFARRKTIG